MAKNLAIAYNVQKKNKPKNFAKGGKVEADEKKEESHLEKAIPPASPKEEPKAEYDEESEDTTSGSPDEHSPHTGENEQAMRERHAMELAELHMAQGGMVPDMKENYQDEDEGENDPENTDADNLVEKILKKRKMASGGIVEDSDDEGPGVERGFNIDAKGFKNNGQSGVKDFNYSDSGEDGDSQEDSAENMHDDALINAIRKRMKK